jgi:hypothetical protein
MPASPRALAACRAPRSRCLSTGLRSRRRGRLPILLGAPGDGYVWATPERLSQHRPDGRRKQVDGFALRAVRAPGNPAPEQVMAGAFDDKGRRIADATIAFGPGETLPRAPMTVPFELRNDFASISHRWPAAGGRHPRAGRQLQAPPRRPAVAGRGRSGAAAAVAALLHPQRAAALRRSGRAASPDLARRSRRSSSRSRR